MTEQVERFLEQKATERRNDIAELISKEEILEASKNLIQQCYFEFGHLGYGKKVLVLEETEQRIVRRLNEILQKQDKEKAIKKLLADIEKGEW